MQSTTRRLKILGFPCNIIMKIKHILPESETIQLPSRERETSFIQAAYSLYPQTWQNNHIMPLGKDEDGEQQFAMFELAPSFVKKGAVEIKWVSAYPLRQGIGTKAIKILQNLAQQHGVALTLHAWDKGQISQSKLLKFYKSAGFAPVSKGSKNMLWEPAANRLEVK